MGPGVDARLAAGRSGLQPRLRIRHNPGNLKIPALPGGLNSSTHLICPQSLKVFCNMPELAHSGKQLRDLLGKNLPSITELAVPP